MRRVGRRGVEVKEIHGGEMKRRQKKEAHKAMYQNSTEENKRMYKSMKNKANKVASKAMRDKAEEALIELQNCQNWMLRQVKRLKTDGKEA